MIRQRARRSYVGVQIMKYNGLRMLTGLVHRASLGPEASIGKLFWSTWHRQLGELAMDVLGAERHGSSRANADGAYELDELHAGLHVQPVGDDLRRRERDPAQHHRRAGARAPEGTETTDDRGQTRELRLLRGAGRAAAHGAAVPRGQVARDRGPAAHGDHRGLRPGGVEADGPGARAPVARTSPRSSAARASRSSSSASCSRRWAACCCARRTSRRSCSRPNAILNVGTDDQKQALLPGIASGETIATLAFTEPNGKWDVTGITMEAQRARAAASRSTGTKMFVLDGHTADLIVVVARTGRHERRGRHRVLHGRRRRRRAHPHAARDDGPDPQAGEARVRGRRGAAARQRRRRLGGALQDARPGRGRHSPTRWSAARSSCSTCRCSTPRTACSSAARSARSRRSSTSAPTCCSRSSRRSRRRTTRRGPPPRTTTSCRWSPRLAKAYCSDAYFHAAAENIQIHGGIGFTWEHNAHLYFKRAKRSEILLGDATYHRELLAQRIGI